MASLNGQAPSANGRARETHQWQFREQSIPPRIWYLLLERKITRNDLLLISVISSLTSPQTDEAGRGCWASNQYLANAIKASPKAVSNQISALEKQGLLVICYVGEQRYVEIEWSRTAEERKNLEGEYGEVHRRAHRELLDRLAQAKENENVEPLPQTCGADPSTNLWTPTPQVCGPIAKVEDYTAQNNNNIKMRPAARAMFYGDPSLRLDRKDEEKSQAEQYYQTCTDKLWDALFRSYPEEVRNESKKEWVKEFAFMCSPRCKASRSPDEITPVLDWYVNHIGEHCVPEAFNAKMFRIKFNSIRRAMNRSKNKCPFPTVWREGREYAMVPYEEPGIKDIEYVPVEELGRKRRNGTGDWYAH